MWQCRKRQNSQYTSFAFPCIAAGHLLQARGACSPPVASKGACGMMLCRKTLSIPVLVFLCKAIGHMGQQRIIFRMFRFPVCTQTKKNKKLEVGSSKTIAAKYSTQVQQKEQKRQASKPTWRNKGQGGRQSSESSFGCTLETS